VLPGRRYTPGDIWHLVVRFKWLVVLPWIAVSVGVSLFARTLPDRYMSESLIQVVPQRVPENLVRSTITSGIEERLPVITQQILSRTRLERIIQDFGLYQRERQTELMEDIVRDMRDDIGVDPVKGDAFRVSYVSNDARTAVRVTERLASLFVEENLRDREVLAEGANQFLDSQLDDARRRLLDSEKRVEDYKRQYQGELPSELSTNLQQVQNAQQRLAQNAESNNRDAERRLQLERQISDLEAEGAAAAQAVPVVDPTTIGSQPAGVRLAMARAQLTQMELQLKPDHPDILRAKRVIRDLEVKAEAETLAAPLSGTPGAQNPAEAQRLKRLQEAKFQLEQVDRQIAQRQEDSRRAQARIGELERRMASTGTRESELIALTRDYATLEKIYTNLLAKSEDAKVAANLERRQIGEQFKVIDQARLPERPFSPNRLQIYFGGIAGGLGLGLALVGLLEYRDSSFRTDRDVVGVLALPVLAVIPAILTDEDRRGMRRRRLMVAAASVVVAGVFGAGAVAWRLNLLQRLF
jgi:polysaccharide chain length determinant protein (PEP-CTERM system associated)